MRSIACWLLLVTVVAACGDDDDDHGVTEAQQRGVGDACGSSNDCVETAPDCLTNFKGGYCGIRSCISHQDCPNGSACVAHSDGMNYCFLVCRDKPECNYFRPAESESNCSSNADFVDGARGRKACIPPS